MALIETDALILKAHNLSDADKIVVCLTRHRGLVRGVAKGAKRLKSKFGGGLEPFSIVHLTYIEKEERELVSIEQVELLKSFFDEASDPNFLQKFAYLIDLLVQFAPPSEPNENLYKMAKVCLEAAVIEPSKLEPVSYYFEYWVLRLSGYLPDWQSCRNCRRDFDDSEVGQLQNDFDLLCVECNAEAKSQRISVGSRVLFDSPRRLSPKAFVETVDHDSKDLVEVSHVVRRIISRVLDREVANQRPIVANSPV